MFQWADVLVQLFSGLLVIVFIGYMMYLTFFKKRKK